MSILYKAKASVELSGGHYFAEWYQELSDGCARSTRWWGTRAECLEVAKLEDPPAGTTWKNIDGWEPDRTPGSAAWCETYSDMGDA